ncbi:MAG: autoinducer 2 import system permease LsrD [Cardiobacteriaceae bacterium]|nr:autoinducer 2 import system permease LsrD [Cardiobacteriaceae bacterium]
MKKRFYRWESVLFLILVAELFLFAMIEPHFIQPANLLYGTTAFVQIGMVALPLTLVMIAGGIDISFAASIGLCAIVFGVANHAGLPLAASIALALIAGALCGLLNGILIGITKIQALVITLGTLYLFKGMATVLSGTVGASGFEGIGGFPEAFLQLGYMSLGDVPVILLIFLAETAFFFWLLHYTRFGRKVYLCGLNEHATRYAGIHLPTVQTLCHILLGLMSGVAALTLSAYFSSARSDLGSDTLLPAITAVVLGGASIYGGQGSIIGTLLATLIVGFLQQGLQMAGVSSQIAGALSGALLVCAVLLRQSGAGLGRVFAALRKSAAQPHTQEKRG